MARAKRLREIDELAQRLLAEAVAESGKPQAEIGAIADMSQNRVGIILRRETPPATVGELSAIARAVGRTGTEFVSQAEESLAGDLNTEPTLAPVTPLRPATTPSTPSPPALDKAAARTIHHRPQWESTRQWDNIGEESQDTDDEA